MAHGAKLRVARDHERNEDRHRRTLRGASALGAIEVNELDASPSAPTVSAAITIRHMASRSPRCASHDSASDARRRVFLASTASAAATNDPARRVFTSMNAYPRASRQMGRSLRSACGRCGLRRGGRFGRARAPRGARPRGRGRGAGPCEIHRTRLALGLCRGDPQDPVAGPVAGRDVQGAVRPNTTLRIRP